MVGEKDKYRGGRSRRARKVVFVAEPSRRADGQDCSENRMTDNTFLSLFLVGLFVLGTLSTF